jgi:hypothetical protein
MLKIYYNIIFASTIIIFFSLSSFVILSSLYVYADKLDKNPDPIETKKENGKKDITALN